VVHQNWIYDSLCCGCCLNPADYVVTEERLAAGLRMGSSQMGGGGSGTQG
jgi:hypothetical protein